MKTQREKEYLHAWHVSYRQIAGIDIDIHMSWIILVVLLTVSLATGWFPQLYPGWSTATYWLIAFLSSLLLFVSVLLHELAHWFVVRRRGLPVKSITLFIFGGVSNIEQEPPSPGVEFQMAFVGPLTSLVLGAICFLLQVPLRGSNSPLEGILFYLAVTNILLGLFNLIPGFPLDGGRVLRSIVWKLTGNLRQATRVASLTGQVIAYLIGPLCSFLRESEATGAIGAQQTPDRCPANAR